MRSKLPILLVFTLSPLLTIAKRPFDLKIDEFSCSSSGPPVKDYHCYLYEKDNKQYLDSHLIFATQVEAMDVRVVAKIPRAGGESLQLVNVTIDACQVLEGADYNNLIRVALEFMRKAGDIPRKCPLMANKNYSVNGLYVDADLLPLYSPEFSFLSKIDFLFRQKVGITFILNGRVERKKKGLFKI